MQTFQQGLINDEKDDGLQIEKTSVAELTVVELKVLIRETVQEVLQELLNDPDYGLELRPEFEKRLRQSIDYVSSGGKMLSIEELTNRIEMD